MNDGKLIRNFVLSVALLALHTIAPEPASAVTCNSPSGFIKSFGTFNTGDVPVFGPGCEQISTSGFVPGSPPIAIPFGFRGYIAEITVASGSAVNLPFQTVVGITSLSQPPGVYDCSGESIFTTAGGALASEYHTTITTIVPPTLQGLPASGGGNGDHIIYVANNSAVFNFGPRRFVVPGPGNQTVFLTGYVTFGNNAGVGNNGVGSAIGYGYLRCETK